MTEVAGRRTTDLVHPGARLIEADTGATLAGATLDARITAVADQLSASQRGTVLALMPPTTEAVVRYLGAMRVGYPIGLLDPDLPVETLHNLIARYEPVLVMGLGEARTTDEPPPGYRGSASGPLGSAWHRTEPGAEPHPDLALLLTTSGSTGNPKLVRLSGRAVHANAVAIATALGIDAAEVAPTTLPLHYTFGLSVLHSHLVRGAAVVLERTGLLQRRFWAAVSTYGVTSVAAVPYQYQMLRRLRFDPARYPTLRSLTQAGGRLAPELIAEFGKAMASAGGRLYVMYGQTEATARMTVLPPDRLTDKLGSVGLPVPGGEMTVRTDHAGGPVEPARGGELVFRGPNVMMGYASAAADLCRGDELNGTLATGDLGYLDDEGFVYVTGRLRRAGKVFGMRVNLDDVEKMLNGDRAVAAVADEDRIVVYLERADAEACREAQARIVAALRTHSSGVDVRGVDSLPLQPSGKVDYRQLEPRG